MDRALGYLGIAQKAGFLTTGADNCGTVVRAGKAKLLMLASDAAENACRRAEGVVYGRKTPLIKLPFDKDTLSAVTGKPGCTMLCLTDIGLASHFAAALRETDPQFAELCAALEEKEHRARQRKAEAASHERNRKVGKRRNKA